MSDVICGIQNYYFRDERLKIHVIDLCVPKFQVMSKFILNFIRQNQNSRSHQFSKINFSPNKFHVKTVGPKFTSRFKIDKLLSRHNFMYVSCLVCPQTNLWSNYPFLDVMSLQYLPSVLHHFSNGPIFITTKTIWIERLTKHYIVTNKIQFTKRTVVVKHVLKFEFIQLILMMNERQTQLHWDKYFNKPTI